MALAFLFLRQLAKHQRPTIKPLLRNPLTVGRQQKQKTDNGRFYNIPAKQEPKPRNHKKV